VARKTVHVSSIGSLTLDMATGFKRLRQLNSDISRGKSKTSRAVSRKTP